CKHGSRSPRASHARSSVFQAPVEDVRFTGILEPVVQAFSVSRIPFARPAFGTGFNVLPFAIVRIVGHEGAIIIAVTKPKIDTRRKILPSNVQPTTTQ